SEPQWCGEYDTPDFLPPGTASNGADIDASAIIAKIAADGLTPFGLVAAALELLFAPEGEATPKSATKSTSDTTAKAGKSETFVDWPMIWTEKLKTAVITALGLSPDDPKLQAWDTSELEGKYQLLVDRNYKDWWPSDDLERGFTGRWGQNVTSDPLSRRA